MSAPSSTPARRFVINASFQYRLVIFVMTVLLAVMGAFYAVTQYFFGFNEYIGEAIGLPRTHAYYDRLQQGQADLLLTFGICAAIVLLTALLVTAFFSYKIVAPIHKMARELETFDDESVARPIEPTSDDYFPELARAFNTRLERLRDIARNSPERFALLFSGDLDLPDTDES
jgi:methyl-accepting chemotaxis protein